MIKKHQKSQMVSFQGRLVPKDNFRAFVYGKNGQRLVNSYSEFVAHISTKEWFETKEDLAASLKPKKAKPNDTDSP